MGLQDREYYRDETSPVGIQFNFQTMVAKLIVVNVGLFIVNIFSSGQLFDYLKASPASLVNISRCWQLLTYGFAHVDPVHILFNMFALWMFGREVEARRGSNEFLVVYLVTLVMGSVVWCGRYLLGGFPADVVEAAANGPWLLGASGAVSAVVMLFILANPKQQLLLFFVVPVPAWAVGALFIFLNVVGTDNNVAYDVHLVGIACAFLYHFSRVTLTRGLPSWVTSSAGRLQGKPALKVHDPDDHYADLDAEADRILDKVHREGESSLTRRERKILKDYSRRMRQKHH